MIDLDKAVKKIKILSKKNKYGIGNEVIFHDPIPMKYLCLVINSKSIDNNIAYKNNIKFSTLLLPPYELYNDEPPDMSKIPFYCIPFENNYTGMNKFKLSSKKFYEKMAILCNVNKNQSRDKIIKDIENKLLDLYNDRKKQKIKEFKKLTI